MTKRASYIYHWSNGRVMAFDQFGEQMPQIQMVGQVSAEKLNGHIKAWWRVGMLSVTVRVVRGAKWNNNFKIDFA